MIVTDERYVQNVRDNINTISETPRPKVGDPMALFWVLGYLQASSGIKTNPFHRTDLNSSIIYQQGHDARTLERR